MSNKLKNSYLSIDCSNYFKESSLDEENEIKYKKKIYKEINEDDKNNLDYLKLIVFYYLQKSFPEEKEFDNFSLSLCLSKHFCKSKNLNKNTIEKYINYFYNNRMNITYSNSFILNIEVAEKIGSILSYIYSSLDDFKLKSKKEIKNNIKENGDLINVLTDFYNYCVDNNLTPNEEKKSLFWLKNRKKYNLPGELIFLINLFKGIIIFDFDINFQDESLNEEQFKCLYFVLMNLDLFLINIKSFKFNLIHEKFQNYYYYLYHKKILNIMNPDTLKINHVKDSEELYTRKWNFEHTFMLEEYRNIELIYKKKIKLQNEEKIFDDFTIIQDSKGNTFNNIYLKNNDNLNDDNDFDYDNNTSFELNNANDSFFDIQSTKTTIQRNIINYQKSNTFNYTYMNDYIDYYYNNNSYKKNKEVIRKYHYTLEIIFILFYYSSNYLLENLENIDLIMNDPYIYEIKYYFREYLKIDMEKDYYNFHILDIYNYLLREVKSLNVEIDSFDLISCEKILKTILYNRIIKELKISFFTCDVNYFPYTLERSYLNYTNEKLSIKNSENNENYLLDFFYPEFKSNLLFLFFLIKNKSLNKLGLNFDIPIIVQKKDNYMMTILKFILNIFIYLNEPNCKINILTLLSPKTILNGNIMNNIDKIFEEMDCNETNMFLYELNIQFTLYKIPNIKNIITKNLINLSIGDLDEITFESVVNYMNSYKFANTSLLRQLKIKLINNIDFLSPKIKIILRNLFNVKLKNLKKLGLYTNIKIKNQKECSFISKILRDNWISSYTLIFNKYSQDMFKKYMSNNIITYLVPHNLENEIIGPDNNNNKKVSTNRDDVVYWYLKYIFNNRYYYINKNFKAQKYCIYNVLKYLYFIKKINIFYDITNDSEKKN